MEEIQNALLGNCMKILKKKTTTTTRHRHAGERVKRSRKKEPVFYNTGRQYKALCGTKYERKGSEEKVKKIN